MPGKRILLVDYDPRSLSHIREVLESAGFDVSTCSDGLSALDQYKNLSPDLVLLSAMLPKMHGFEVCSNIRRLPGGDKTPVVIITDVYKGKRYRIDAINKYGATEYIEKPIEDSSLVGILKNLANDNGKATPAVHEDDDKTVQFSRDLLDRMVHEEVTGATKTEHKTVTDKKEKDEISKKLEESLAGLDLGLDLGGRSKTRSKPAKAEPSPQPKSTAPESAVSSSTPGDGATFTAEDLFTDVIASVERELQSESIPEEVQEEGEDGAPTMAIPAPESPVVDQEAPVEQEVQPEKVPEEPAVDQEPVSVAPEPEKVAEPVKKDDAMTVALSAADLGLTKEAPKKASTNDLLDKKLTDTLSGLMKEGKTSRPKAPRKEPEKPAAPTLMMSKPPVVEPPPAAKSPEPAATVIVEKAPVVEKAPSVSAAQEGIYFGNYILLGKIATGGMAELFKAKRKGVEGFEKILAIKRILPHMSDNEDFVTMFIDEAKLAAQLTHHNICQIFDLGKIEDSYYIAMEYVHGKDLRAVLKSSRTKNKPFQVDLAVLVASRLCSALDYAHRKKGSNGKPLNLVHRDVSPQNILISYEGEVKLVDFGIAKAATKAHVTQHGALKGKLLYMSPEQAWGKRVDKRTDIFSLGIVLYELLTGQPLFFGENDTEVTILEKVREARVAPVREFNSRVSPELEKIVLKALKKNPDERYQSASEVQRDLDNLFYSESYSATSASLAEYVRELFQEEWIREGDIKDQVATMEEIVPVVEPPVGAAAAGAPSPVVPEKSPEPLPKKEEKEKGQKAVRDISMPEIMPPQETKSFPILPVGIGLAVIVGIIVFFLFRPSQEPASSPTSTPVPAQATVSQEAPVPAEEPGTVQEEAVEEPATETASMTAEEQKAAEKAAEDQKKLEAQKKAEEDRKKEEERKKEELAKLQEEQKQAQQPAPEPVPAPPVEEKKTEPAPVEEAPVEEAKAATPQPLPTPPAQEPPQQTAPKEPPKPKSTVKEGDLVELTPDVTKPELVKRKNPSYPPAALAKKIEGTVILSILVNEQGKVADVKVLREAGGAFGLNEAAADAVKGWTFQPAVKEGKRVKVWVTYPIVFKLQN